jgi:hypothetical protein
MNVARFFVYALLGSDNKGLYAKDNLAAAIALRGIRLVIPEFREDLTKTRKDGTPGALRITYGPGVSYVNQSEWLWKYLDGARSAGELYGRALIVIAAEHYATRLVIPASQHEEALSWRSHENIAPQALTKLAGPHIAPTLEALRKAVAKADREYKEDRTALLTGTSRSGADEPDTEDTAETDLAHEATDDADEGVRKQALSFIQIQPGITIPELAARMGVKQNCLYRVLPELEDEGSVCKQGRGWHPTDAKTTDEEVPPATVPGGAADEQELLTAADSPVSDVDPQDLAPPVDASNVEQVNEGPAPMVALPDHPDAAAEDDIVDAAAEIDF